MCFPGFMTLVSPQVPPEVHVVAERYCRKRSKRKRLKMSSYNSSIGEWEEDEEEEEDVTLDLYSTCCKRECVEAYHETGKENAMDEVAKLYELVKDMPDGPQKAHFMKRVCITSMYVSTALDGGCTTKSYSILIDQYWDVCRHIKHMMYLPQKL